MSIDPFRQCDEMYRGEATKKKPATTLCLVVSVMSICNALYSQYMWYLHVCQYNFSDVHTLFAVVMSRSCGTRLAVIILPNLWLKGGRGECSLV